MSKKIINFQYLNYIDALRAISVVLVIFFHLNPEYFSLGYLGVDIFFVISGYVITNSIYEQQLVKNKSIFFFM
jgi:peptidoglycan/LPS O-acetylase OafA/YrhL